MHYNIHEIRYHNNTLEREKPSKLGSSSNHVAIIVHIFYLDVWEEILEHLKRLDIRYDLYITISDDMEENSILDILKDVPDAKLYMLENRGRDVLPFLQILKIIGIDSYTYICKIHTKKSVTSDNGDAWRTLLYYDLIGSQDIVQDTLNTFQNNEHIGILTGKNLILNAIKFDLGNLKNIKKLSSMSDISFVPDYHFAAGTMFWIRPSILSPLLPLIKNNLLQFEDEDGQSDHTLAHALERFFGLLCEDANYILEESSADYSKLDKDTLEDLAVLAFTQRFKYDLQLQHKDTLIQARDTLIQKRDTLIQERDENIVSLENSLSYKVTKPLRMSIFIFNTLKHFKLKKINVIGTDEHRLKLAIKRRIPNKIFQLLKRIFSSNEPNKKAKKQLWHEPLTSVSKNKGQKILIVAELSIPQCKKYRVDQKVEMLSYLGYESTVVSWTNFQEARNILQLCGLVIFYRIPAHDIVKDLINEANRLSVPTIFDVDDLVFEKKLLQENINIQNLARKEKQGIFEGADLYRNTLSLSKYSIASTMVLAKYMSTHCQGENHLLPNCLDKELLQYLNIENQKKDTDKIKIVYGSGTSTHDIDFLEATDALLYILKKYKNVQLIIHGTLKLPDAFSDFSSQITNIPFMKSDAYYTALQSYDINIAPLEQSVFNDAKSNIKYLEASLLKLPTVASSTVEYVASIEDGIDGYLAKDTEAWIHSLESLILNSTSRVNMGKLAHKKVLNIYKIETIAKKYMLPILEKYLYKEEKDVVKVIMTNVLYSPISFGGATIVIEELSKIIAEQKKYEVTIFTGFFDSERDLPREHDIIRYEVNNIPVVLVRFPEPMSKKLDYHNDLMASVFNDVLVSLKPDIVHFHSIQQLSASIITPCITHNIPYLITLHDMWWLCEKQFMIMPDKSYCHQKNIDTDYCITHCTKNEDITHERTQYLKPFLHQATLLLTPSDFQAKMYLDNGFQKEHIKVNKNGILFPSKSYKRTKSHTVRFAYLGGNAVHKGYEHIKNIFESVTSSNYELLLVDLHRKLGHDSIYEEDWDIKGKLSISSGYNYSQEGLDDFFKSVDVLLFPSQWKESFGLTIREALVRDVWVISTDSGGVVEDIIEGENGNIVSMFDAQSLQKKIENSINNPDFFKTYTNPYKERIRSYKEQADELMSYYHKILDSL